MYDIRVTCQSCEAWTVIRPDRILLLADPGRDAGDYLFLCPMCERLTVRSASPADVRLLLGAGVPDARAVGRSAHVGDWPTFTRDDLLDFHLLLETDEWFSELA